MERLFISRQSQNLNFDLVNCEVFFPICTFDLPCKQLFSAKKKYKWEK